MKKIIEQLKPIEKTGRIYMIPNWSMLISK